MNTTASHRIDPRYYQIVALSCLVLYSLIWFRFGTSPFQFGPTII